LENERQKWRSFAVIFRVAVNRQLKRQHTPKVTVHCGSGVLHKWIKSRLNETVAKERPSCVCGRSEWSDDSVRDRVNRWTCSGRGGRGKGQVTRGLVKCKMNERFARKVTSNSCDAEQTKRPEDSEWSESGRRRRFGAEKRSRLDEADK
jgi:hypothetical protein